MTKAKKQKAVTDTPKDLGKVLWSIADTLRGSMNADDFRDYMLAFLFLYYLSKSYEDLAKKILKCDWDESNDSKHPLKLFYEKNPESTQEFEDMMKNRAKYIIKPEYLWSNLVLMAMQGNDRLIEMTHAAFKYIERESFGSDFKGLFSEINLESEKLGKTNTERNARLIDIVKKIDSGLHNNGFSTDVDSLGDAYEYLISQFAAGSGKKAGEFYTPQAVSSILSGIVSLDSQDPKLGVRQNIGNVLDMTCGSGSLLLNVRHQLTRQGSTIRKLYGQEKNITTYNLARMNMLLHGVGIRNFDIFHGDTLANDWPLLKTEYTDKTIEFDAIVANPPFSYRWEPSNMQNDARFKGHGLAPKSAADFAFLLHGFHYLSEKGVMAIILPHGVLFRGGSELNIRKKLLEDGHIDTIIGLPSNLFFSTGIPVCIIVLKKCKQSNDILFINASEHFEKKKKQNELSEEHIREIIETYQYRTEKERYSRRVSMNEIRENDYNLNITRYVSTEQVEEQIDLNAVQKKLQEVNKRANEAKAKHNKFLEELGLELLP